MDKIERRIESDRPEGAGIYTERTFSREERDKGRHRSFVGGKWETMGDMQRDFLVSHGLKPNHKVMDVGCGSLRAGRVLVQYLESGNYYGIDSGYDVIEAGYEEELDDAGRERLPAANLRCTDRFDMDFGVKFDMAIAQSVFTHISLNHIRLCLYRLSLVMDPGATFYATFFERGPKYPIDGVRGRTYTERNMYWYYRSDMRWAASRLPFKFKYIGDWGHPVDQRMVAFTRTAD